MTIQPYDDLVIILNIHLCLFLFKGKSQKNWLRFVLQGHNPKTSMFKTLSVASPLQSP